MEELPSVDELVVYLLPPTTSTRTTECARTPLGTTVCCGRSPSSYPEFTSAVWGLLDEKQRHRRWDPSVADAS